MLINEKTKANKKFQKAVKEYKDFLRSLAEMGYGEYTRERLKAEGREDLLSKDIKLEENFIKALDELIVAL